MPMTPLHLAAALPIRKHISMKAFIAVNVLIDIEPISIVLFNLPADFLHGGFHTMAGAFLLALATCGSGVLFGGDLKRWVTGSAFGAASHILMDALVHRDVSPFWPLTEANPLFLDAHLEVSILCAAVLCYYLVLWIRSLRIGKVLAGR